MLIRKTINSDHGTLSYRTGGEGPLLMLIHGFPCDSTLWDHLIPGLQTRFRLLVPDLPGAGESEGYEPLSIESLASDLLQLAKAEHAAQMIVAGHSMGGYIALAMAAQEPGVFLGLALVHSTALPDDEARKQQRDKSNQLIAKDGREAFVKQMVPNLFAPAHRSGNNPLLKQLTEKALALEAQSMIRFNKAMKDRPDRRNVAAAADFPLQWVAGAQDGVIPKEKILQQSTLANVSSVDVLARSGHVGMLEEPDRLTEILIKFGNFCSQQKQGA